MIDGEKRYIVLPVFMMIQFFQQLLLIAQLLLYQPSVGGIEISKQALCGNGLPCVMPVRIIESASLGGIYTDESPVSIKTLFLLIFHLD